MCILTANGIADESGSSQEFACNERFDVVFASECCCHPLETIFVPPGIADARLPLIGIFR